MEIKTSGCNVLVCFLILTQGKSEKKMSFRLTSEQLYCSELSFGVAVLKSPELSCIL